MLQLIRNGGFPMFFILAFGLIALGLAARFASKPVREQLALVRAMSSATLYATLTGTVAASQLSPLSAEETTRLRSTRNSPSGSVAKLELRRASTR